MTISKNLLFKVNNVIVVLSLLMLSALTSGCFTQTESLSKKENKGSQNINPDINENFNSFVLIQETVLETQYLPTVERIEYLSTKHPDYLSESKTLIELHNDISENYWFNFSNRSQQINKNNIDSFAVVKVDYRAPGLWGTLVENFKFFNQYENHKQVKKFVKYIINNPRIFDRTTSGASLYLYYVYNEIKKRNMPMELALLPIIESRYYPFAISKRRAAGLWQFTPKTGKHYGLKQNWWYDGRFDIVESTNSALNLLQDLHDRYDDWLLALAAYNYGLGNVNKAIKKAKEKGIEPTYWNIKLPKETREYVPKLLAYCYIMTYFEKYNLLINPIEERPLLASVKINRPLELEVMAKASKLSLSSFRKINPGFRRWATKPQEQYNILVPLSNKQNFISNIAALGTNYQVKWRSHKVKSGDTLYDLARFYGTSVQALKKANRLKKHIIKPGEQLIIPAKPT